MNRIPPFHTLLELAGKSMDEAFSAVGEASARQRAAEEQLLKLQGYRHEYVRGLQESMARGLLSSHCQNTQHFISTLDDAIHKQSGILGQMQKQVVLERDRWMKARQKVSSMQALVKRDAERVRQTSARLEQKSADEFAARAHRRTHQA